MAAASRSEPEERYARGPGDLVPVDLPGKVRRPDPVLQDRSRDAEAGALDLVALRICTRHVNADRHVPGSMEFLADAHNIPAIADQPEVSMCW